MTEVNLSLRGITAPRAPVLEWGSLAGSRGASEAAVDAVPYGTLTTSGRAALWLGLKSLGLAAGRAVLVPTYHCPTMIAAVVDAGLRPVFYPLGEDGLPRLSAMLGPPFDDAGAIVVAHLFGRAQSLAAVRTWCDGQACTLIEDCAHTFFGMAGERAVGQWGDLAIASITKFFPVPEAGLLVSPSPRRSGPALTPRSMAAELKGAYEVVERSTRSGRLSLLRPLVHAAQALRTSPARSAPSTSTAAAANALPACDMGRIGAQPLAVARWLWHTVPRGPIVLRRRQHAALLLEALLGIEGARPLMSFAPTDVPYALPLWVDDADAVYAALRASGMPVFRWDERWPGTPDFGDDVGGLWSKHVLQLLCHQSLSSAELLATAAAVRQACSRRSA